MLGDLTIVRIAPFGKILAVIAGTSDHVGHIADARPIHAPVPTREKGALSMLILYVMVVIVSPAFD